MRIKSFSGHPLTTPEQRLARLEALLLQWRQPPLPVLPHRAFIGRMQTADPVPFPLPGEHYALLRECLERAAVWPPRTHVSGLEALLASLQAAGTAGIPGHQDLISSGAIFQTGPRLTWAKTLPPPLAGLEEDWLMAPGAGPKRIALRWRDARVPPPLWPVLPTGSH